MGRSMTAALRTTPVTGLARWCGQTRTLTRVRGTAGCLVHSCGSGAGKAGVALLRPLCPGLWHDGRPQGPGHYRWACGDEYDGEWSEGRMEGNGTYIWRRGEVRAAGGARRRACPDLSFRLAPSAALRRRLAGGSALGLRHSDLPQRRGTNWHLAGGQEARGSRLDPPRWAHRHLHVRKQPGPGSESAPSLFPVQRRMPPAPPHKTVQQHQGPLQFRSGCRGPALPCRPPPNG